MDELVGELEDDPAENLRIMLSQVKSRVAELETELSDAAVRSSRELEQHVKLLSTVMEQSLPNSPLKQAEQKVYELESKLEEQTEPSMLLEQAQQKVLLEIARVTPISSKQQTDGDRGTACSARNQRVGRKRQNSTCRDATEIGTEPN